MVKVVKRGKMKTEDRPWGRERHFIFNTQCTVKILTVKPHQMLSLQYHQLREESWYFLTDGFVQIGLERRKVKKGELVRIKHKQAHRIIAEKTTVEVLEISTGKFRKSDIVRIDDKYGRAK